MTSQSPDLTALHRSLGARPQSDGSTQFCVWCPGDDPVTIEFPHREDSLTLDRREGGYWVGGTDQVQAGDQYLVKIGDRQPRPDPASRYQPQGVHGPSQIVDPTEFVWTDQKWSGVRREDLIIYELHLGAFTDDGTFAAAIKRLDELVELGVTAVELMPVADAAGQWNWGYDGVHFFAPNRNYGTPDDLRRFVDQAHHKGLAVILDVVYNHFGPEGNYLGHIAPYLSPHHSTVWGDAPNFDDPVHGEAVRHFFIANTVYWLDEFHIDGLRVDAIHCMMDASKTHVVKEISRAVQRWSKQNSRPAMLIAESNIYDVEMIRPLSGGGYGFDAEWCDDFLHSVFAVVRPGEHLSDRNYDPRTDLDQVLRFGYVFEGAIGQHRHRRRLHQRIDTSGLIYSIQTHDFIGNHPLGQRLHQLTSVEAQQAAAALLLLSPAIPMLFMGEEFACEHPFRFFVDFQDQTLRKAVVEGRRLEYPQHDWSSGVMPIDPRAFEGSKIGAAAAGNESVRNWYRDLIRLRKRCRREGLIGDNTIHVDTDLETGLFQLSYASSRHRLLLAARLNAAEVEEHPLPIEVDLPLQMDSRVGQTVEDELLPNHAKIYFDRR